MGTVSRAVLAGISLLAPLEPVCPQAPRSLASVAATVEPIFPSWYPRESSSRPSTIMVPFTRLAGPGRVGGSRGLALDGGDRGEREREGLLRRA